MCTAIEKPFSNPSQYKEHIRPVFVYCNNIIKLARNRAVQSVYVSIMLAWRQNVWDRAKVRAAMTAGRFFPSHKRTNKNIFATANAPAIAEIRFILCANSPSGMYFKPMARM